MTEKSKQMTTKTERLTGALKSAAQKGKQAWKVAKTGVKTAVAATVVGTGIHVYHQFHKTPEQARKDTITMTHKVQKSMDDMTRTNKVARTIAGAGARHGGALREWIIQKTQKSK